MPKTDKRKLKRLLVIMRWLSVEIKPILATVLIITAIGAFVSVASIYMTFISKDLIDAAIAAKVGFVQKYALFFAGIMVLQIGLNAVLSIMTMTAGEKAANGLRARLFSHMTKADYMEVGAYHSGDVLTRMTSDVNAVVGLYVGLVPSIIALVVQLVGAFFALFIFSKPLAILAFLIAPFTLLITRVFAGRLAKLSKSIQEAESKYRSYMGESIQNMLIIKTFELSSHTVSKFKELQYNRFGLVLQRTKLNIGLSSMLSVGYFTGYFLAFYYGAMGLMAGTITFGTMAAFLQLVEKIQSPFMSLASTIPKLISVAVSAERLMAFEEIELESFDQKEILWKEAGFRAMGASFAYALDQNSEDDEFTTFSDPGSGMTPVGSAKKSGEFILKAINFEVIPGEVVGLVGASGEGKTTLIRLLLALVRPDEGHIEFFSEKGETLVASGSTRSLISYVPQGNTLFSGTLRDNILAGNTLADDENIFDVLKTAEAYDFVMELEDGLDTVMGELGLGLSEGQAQRIAIARALLRKGSILVLDEATSALDTETEQKVLKNIQDNRRHKTCLFITHRPSVLKICDRIYGLKSGELSEIEEVGEEIIKLGLS